MKKYIISTILIICCHFFVIAQSEKNFIDQNYIEITGTAETLVTPNEIYIAITLTEKNHKKTIEEQEQLLLANLKSLGVDTDKELSVSNFEGIYTKRFLKRNEVEKVKKYQLIVHDGKTLSKTYLVLDQLNITNVNITKVSHSDLEKIRRETKIKSLIVAKQKATEYAEAIDQEIGKALFIKEVDQNSYAQINVRGMNTSNAYFDNNSLSKIEDLTFQKISITATVLTKFELKTKKE
ncbi:hypothetical protein IMCC3317_35880 [Kordia antarctica]|uniref:26 kDa periplasmic immunogenic protein n=1 Tax=Kordia antarctica TaxID=1218801 RepID=A0A7L4ZNX7_9FLAO|nr:SIMPL domain-containing protein [Kordia antarctica]QHI38201.1 hypothetical protein IMCC3317_35880 [Kordia antarctica]